MLSRLLAGGFDATAGVWAKAEGDGQYYLYIVHPPAETRGIRPGFGQVLTELRQMDASRLWASPFERVDPFAVKLVEPSDPLARGVLDHYQRFPDDHPTWHQGSILGSVPIDGAYIYPAGLFKAQAAPEPAPAAPPVGV